MGREDIYLSYQTIMKTSQLNDRIIGGNQREKIKSKSNIISKIKQKILEIIKTSEAKSLGHLTHIEVFGLMRAEEGLDLYPLDMYQGVIKGNLHYKKKVPMMKRLNHIGYNHGISRWKDWKDDKRKHNKNAGQGMIEKAIERGYIIDNEIEVLEKLGFVVITEDIPSIFVIAPKVLKNDKKVEAITSQLKDLIILIKHGEDDFERVYNRDQSQLLNKGLQS